MEKAEKVLSREAVNKALEHTQHWTKETFMEKVRALFIFEILKLTVLHRSRLLAVGMTDPEGS